MIVKVLIGIVIGVALGGLLGSTRSCDSGGCPLTANPWRGAMFGGILGCLFALTMTVQPDKPQSRHMDDKALEAPPQKAPDADSESP